MISFILEHTNLVVVNLLILFNCIGSNLLSKNEVSFPEILVPVTDLMDAVTEVEELGVKIS